MDIDELIDQFIAAYDAWAVDEDEFLFGKKFQHMVAARDRLEVARQAYWAENERIVTANETF